ncbi:MAG TPA: molecular chaperone HtpG [Kofleriaceae bacterium]
MSSERHEFQAEVKQLLDLVVHSLYSDRDVFLRELVSNASDALDKLRFEQLSADFGAVGTPSITLTVDAAARTLSIADTGIGMSRDEVVKNIGTIAKSGTKEFLRAAAAAASSGKALDLIGQFGVGFYSAFMVADRISLVTRRAGEAGATLWESTGDGTYTVEDATRDEPGTTVTLHLKPADPEAGLPDYTSAPTITEIVKRYSDFVAYPIVLDGKTLNSQKAIWDRAKGEVTDEEYREFYRHLTHDWQPPLRSIPVKLEGTLEVNALLYLPAKAPPDLYSPEMRRGLSLYVRRVFVMEENKDLLPQWLRFVRGVVDAHDLPLNVSREILQKDRQLPVIRKQLVKRVLGTLEELQRDQRDEYVGFWAELGPVLKEGLAGFETSDRDKLLDLVLVATTRGSDPTTLGEYVSRMPEAQTAIYYLVGASAEAARRSPLLEAFAAKGTEVLLFSDPIDELWLDREPEFRGKKLVSVGKGSDPLGDAPDLADKQKEYGDLLGALRVALDADIKEVRLSSRLTSSAAVIVTDEHDLSPRMQRMLEQMGQTPPKVKRILELNPTHPLIANLQRIFAASPADPRLAAAAHLLLGQAQLSELGTILDPAQFSTALFDILLRAT